MTYHSAQIIPLPADLRALGQMLIQAPHNSRMMQVTDQEGRQWMLTVPAVALEQAREANEPCP